MQNPFFRSFRALCESCEFPSLRDGLRDQSLEGGSDIRLHLEGAASGNQKVVPLEESED